MTATASSITATRIAGLAAFLIARLSFLRQLGLQESLDHPIRSRQHIRRYHSDFRFSILDFGLLDHRITLSALAKTLGGIINPICWAVLRLMTNSNFIGCSTGKSAGFVPLRILSILMAARLITSMELGP